MNILMVYTLSHRFKIEDSLELAAYQNLLLHKEAIL